MTVVKYCGKVVEYCGTVLKHFRIVLKYFRKVVKYFKKVLTYFRKVVKYFRTVVKYCRRDPIVHDASGEQCPVQSRECYAALQCKVVISLLPCGGLLQHCSTPAVL